MNYLDISSIVISFRKSKHLQFGNILRLHFKVIFVFEKYLPNYTKTTKINKNELYKKWTSSIFKENKNYAQKAYKIQITKVI